MHKDKLRREHVAALKGGLSDNRMSTENNT
jgi:hypothetical protein